MAALPFASAGTTAYSFPLAALLTIALLPLALQTARARKGREASAPVHFGPLIPASVLAVALGVVLLWGLATRESGSLVVTFLDVGQGDAILIESPAGQRILVDGGPSAPVLSQALSRAGAFASSRIDLVVLTHAQDDHVTGLIAAIERFEIGAVLVPPLEGQTATNAAFRALVEKRAIPVLHAHAGSVIDLGRGAAIEVLWPAEEPLLGTADDLNNNSIVLRLVYGSVSVLLTGDIAGPAEEALGRAGELRATLLKVPHHGSDSSSTPAFLNAVAPAVAVVSAGAGNSFGHPSPTTLLRLAGIPVYRTDRNGNVRVETDGFRMKVSVERGHFQFIEPALAGEGR
jgi:competence protein ComEC